MSTVKTARRLLREGLRRAFRSFAVALVLLAGFYAVISGSPDPGPAALVPIGAALYAAILISLRAAQLPAGPLRVAGAAAGFALLARIAEPGFGVSLAGPRSLVDVALLLTAPAAVLAHIFSERRVTSEVIFAALTVYLFIGMLFGAGYEMIEDASPGAISFPEGVTQSTYYFSLVTLTTLGYGDVTPLDGAARSVAVLEALVGQVFMVVLVARLVAIQVSQGSDSSTDKG